MKTSLKSGSKKGMAGGLIITRTPGQSITIDGSMTITVARVRGNKVILQIKGHQQVLRTEIYEQNINGPSPL